MLMVYFGISITSGLADQRLAGQARVRLQAPGLVEQVFLDFFRLGQRIETFAHDDMAGGAGAGFFAGVLDVDVVAEQRIADRNAGRGIDHRAVGTQFDMGKYDDLGHRDS